MNKKTNSDLIDIAFVNINAYKRHRAMADSSRMEGNTDRAIYHELKMYKHFDAIELALRGIQREIKGETREDSEENND